MEAEHEMKQRAEAKGQMTAEAAGMSNADLFNKLVGALPPENQWERVHYGVVDAEVRRRLSEWLAEQPKAAADAEHVARCKEEAAAAIWCYFEIDNQVVTDIIERIASGRVPHVTMNYGGKP